MRRSSSVALLAGLIFSSGPVTAAPVFSNLTLSIAFAGTPIILAGSGFIDVAFGTIMIPAGLLTIGGPTTLVPSSTAITSITITQLSNSTGTFALGGVTAQVPAELCPVGGPAAGVACVAGGGVGGTMGMVGALKVHLAPSVTVPVDFATINVGQGGSITTPHVADAAPWTTATGFVHTGAAIQTAMGTIGAGVASLSLVSPTFLLIAGSVLFRSATPLGSPVFSTLTITAVPEPGSVLLIGTGLAGLAALACRKRIPTVPRT